MHLDPFYPQTLREEELKHKVAADTFDNVNGQFPIGFFVWRLGKELTPISSDGYANASPISQHAGALAKASDKSELIKNLSPAKY